MEKEAASQKKNSRTFSKRAFCMELALFLLSFLIGRIEPAKGVVPFGAAMICAASMSGGNAWYAFAGALLGCLLRSDPAWHATALCALTQLTLFLWQLWQKHSTRTDRLVILLLCNAVLLPVFCTGSLDDLLRGLMNTGACLAAALALQSALRTLRSLSIRHVISEPEQVSICIFFGLILLGLAGVQALGFSLPVILLLTFSMIASYAKGIGGVAVAVALSAVLTAGGAFTLMFVGSIASCSLAGAASRRFENYGVAAAFVLTSLLIGTYLYNAEHAINIQNLGISTVLFLMIPRAKLIELCAYIDNDRNRERFAMKAMKRMRDRTAESMRMTADVCRDVAAVFSRGIPGAEADDALRQWAGEAALRVCTDCPMKKLCWKNPDQCTETLLALLKAYERGERIRIRKPFEPSCKQFSQMIAAAFQIKTQLTVQAAMRKQTEEQYAFIHRQLRGICGVLDTLQKRILQDRWLDEELEIMLMRGLDRLGLDVRNVDAIFPDGKLQLRLYLASSPALKAEKICSDVSRVLRRPIRLLDKQVRGRISIFIMEEAQPLSADMGQATVALETDGVSGDTAGEKRLARGQVLFALSDGMGAGAAARKESEAAIRLLFDLYGVGFARDVALESVNKLLLERGDDEMYATLDALHLDLKTGSAEMIKYGAPPTFICRGEHIHVVDAEALPVGILPEAMPAIRKTRLRRNDAVVMLSDGALDALNERAGEWIQESLRRTGSSADAAQMLLQAAQQAGQIDDMTVMVIRIA